MYPNKELLLTLAEQYQRIPVYQTISYEQENIQDLYQTFRGPYSSLFEIHKEEEQYTIITLPSDTLLQSDGHTTYRKEGTHQETSTQNPYDIMSNYVDKTMPDTAIPSFAGGLLGHINYDAIRLQESIKDELPSLALPMFHLFVSKQLIIIDHTTSLVYLISYLSTENKVKQELLDDYEQCLLQLQDMENQFRNPCCFHSETLASRTCYSNHTKEAFEAVVEKAKHHILEGDIFQIVLSQRFSCAYSEDPFHAYCALRFIGHAPYLYYIDFDDYVLAGASPEVLLQVNDRDMMTMPIAGTRKRGKTYEEDQLLEQELLHDHKEIAEHNMLVDLGRNDIGKFCEDGKVSLSQYKQVKRYSHVMHLCSEVHGTLRKDMHPMHALAALLPAGTLSGAPKIRAMELIEAMEPCKREVYGGAICLFDYRQLATCFITIRTILFHQQTAYVQAGAGIVKDSKAEAEYEETYHKASMLLHALGCGGVK